MEKEYYSVGSRIGAWILAILLGLGFSFVVPMELLLPFPQISLTMIFSLLLCAMGGLAPAIAFLAVSSISAFLFLGIAMGAALAAMSILPSVFMLAAFRQKKSFYAQIRIGIIAALAGCVLMALIVALTFGTDFIAQFVDLLRSVYDQNAELYRTMILRMMDLEESAVSLEEFTAIYNETFTQMQLYYNGNLLGNVLSGAIISVLWGVHRANRKRYRRTYMPTETYVPLSLWFLPSDLTWGMLLMVGASYGMKLAGLSSGETVLRTTSAIAIVAFNAQMLASMHRAMNKKEWSTGKCAFFDILYAFLVLFGQGAFFGMDVSLTFAVIGACSALFGSHGALSGAKQND